MEQGKSNSFLLSQQEMEQTKGNAAHDVTAQLSDTLLNDNLSVAEIKDMFQNLHHKALSLGLTQQQICNLNYVTESTPHNWSCSWKLFFRLLSVLSLAVLIGSIVWALDWPISRTTVAMAVWRFRGFKAEEVQSESCLLPLSQSLQPFLRPPIDCEFCMDVNSIKKVTNISSIEFSEKYAHTGRPVVVKDAARNWSATQVFSFEFFKGLYGPFSSVRGSNCQFFPYKTEFRNLSHVFTMDEDRVRQKQGTKPWYIGWSNCDSSAANILRHHYERPYFLPPDSESSNTDWIFMGSPGYGAHMH
ncbi:Jmjc domain-containing protein 4, partial [Biomphalaria glabrata]